MSAEVYQMLKPDPDTMRDHLDHLFGGFLDGCHDGLIELAWSASSPDASGRYKLSNAMLFGTDQIEELIEKACEVNARGRTNVYIGAALRHPDTPVVGRTKDADFYAASAVWVDLDDAEANNEAKHRFAGAKPTMVVRTGVHPHWRHQLWWRLAEPITDPVRCSALVKGMAVHFSGDTSVANPARVMRLAGSIAWDQKPGRKPEVTSIIRLKEPGPGAYMAEHMEVVYPPVVDLITAREYRDAAPRQKGEDNGIVRERNSFGLETGRVIDGREKYMRDLVCARLIEYIGRFGAVPTVEELFDDAWPVFEETTDLSRGGRGPHEMMDKCRYTLQRFNRGEIRGARTIDEAVASYNLKKDARQNSLRHTAFMPAVDRAMEGEGAKPQPNKITATAFDWVSPSAIPPRAWIYGRHYIRKFVSTTVAPGGVGKTALGVVEALSIATGKPLLGVAPDERVNVWLWNGEDPIEEMQRRVMAAALHFGLSKEDVAGRLYVDTGRATPIIIAERTRDGAVVNVPVVEQVIETIINNKIGLMTIDPFVSCHRVTENDNGEIDRVVKMWAYIAEVTGCAIELVHHVRKTNGNEVSVEDGRGAVALLSAARSARALNRMTADEAARAGVKEPGLYFRVDSGKANLAPPSHGAVWYHLASFDLGNSRPAQPGEPSRPSDKVGVVTSWAWPDPLTGVTVDHMNAVRAEVARRNYRADPQAADWVGYAIIETLGLDPDDAAVKQKAKSIQAIWIANQALAVREEQDQTTRKMKKFVRPGSFGESAPP